MRGHHAILIVPPTTIWPWRKNRHTRSSQGQNNEAFGTFNLGDVVWTVPHRLARLPGRFLLTSATIISADFTSVPVQLRYPLTPSIRVQNAHKRDQYILYLANSAVIAVFSLDPETSRILVNAGDKPLRAEYAMLPRVEDTP